MRRKRRLLLVILLFGSILACRPTPMPPISFEPLELPEATVNQPYSVTIAVVGTVTPVYTFTADEENLPPGLSFVWEPNYDTARIEGIPEETGEYAFAVHVATHGTSVNGQTGEQWYTLLVR